MEERSFTPAAIVKINTFEPIITMIPTRKEKKLARGEVRMKKHRTLDKCT